jgi:hypothetical protein
LAKHLWRDDGATAAVTNFDLDDRWSRGGGLREIRGGKSESDDGCRHGSRVAQDARESKKQRMRRGFLLIKFVVCGRV